ncbi:MAG TPA: 3-phosphoshikimate 1-carboxyvinyltransferase [Gammaproteobacteria bacterium]|nr:3-phosphoshikimate 1-carboxyvinyltransferase [Gammaproteobacteria bacterium]
MSPRHAVTFTVEPGGRLEGRIRVPGDKSISHRFVMLSAIAEGASEASGFLQGQDTIATANAFRAMGVTVNGPDDGRLKIEGVGLRGLSAPSAPLDMGNSGTAMRLLAGILAGQSFESSLTGDVSLSRRPMVRVTDPLRRMGARIDTAASGTPPINIRPAGGPLRAIEYALPVASAQVKSCLLLAGLYARGKTCVVEPVATRDHTERMLGAFGHPVEISQRRICVGGGGRLRGAEMEIPGDISSAAFFILGASIAGGSDVLLEGVGVNPTRTGVIEILSLMGADIELQNRRDTGGEPVADVRVRASRLKGIEVPQSLVPLAIDEFPAVFVAAACAEGETRVTGASELRVKESDRIAAMAAGLERLGIETEPAADGMRIRGGRMRGGRVDSRGDHRIAMAFSMAALAAGETVVVDDCANVDTSFPGFAPLAASAGLKIKAGGARR